MTGTIPTKMQPMRNFIFTVILALSATGSVLAKDYVPTEGWPYLYNDFTSALVYYQDGKCESADINVHLMSNELHFTDGENIMVVHDATRIDSVVCENNTKLLNRGNKYVDVLGESSRIVIGRTCEIDVNALTDSNGAYGISTTTAATQNVASFSDHGNVAAHRYQEMIADRHSTREVPTVTRYIFIIDDRQICAANKSGVNDILDKEQRKAFKEFLKANKIKWKETQSLILVAEFLDSIIPVEE